jgi:hypothetical protein
MTERTFETDDYQVVTGWDATQHLLVLDIYTRQGTALDPQPIFSNRELRYPPMTVADLGDALRGYGITAPEGLLQDLATDQARDRDQTTDLGTLYRVTWEDGQTNLFAAADLDDVDLREAVAVERFDQTRWIERAGDTVLTGVDVHGCEQTLSVIEGTHEVDLSLDEDVSGESPSRETTTFGQSDESPGEGNTLVSRLEEVADKVRDLFSRFRHRDQGMER